MDKIWMIWTLPHNTIRFIPEREKKWRLHTLSLWKRLTFHLKYIHVCSHWTCFTKHITYNNPGMDRYAIWI